MEICTCNENYLTNAFYEKSVKYFKDLAELKNSFNELNEDNAKKGNLSESIKIMKNNYEYNKLQSFKFSDAYSEVAELIDAVEESETDNTNIKYNFHGKENQIVFQIYDSNAQQNKDNTFTDSLNLTYYWDAEDKKWRIESYKRLGTVCKEKYNKKIHEMYNFEFPW